MIRSISLLISFLSVLPLLTKAQTPLDYTAIDHARQISFAQQRTFGAPPPLAKKWQLSTFAGVAGSYGFFNHTTASLLSVPVTMQLTHPLSRNLYAFAAVTAAPAYYNFNTSFLQPRPDKYFGTNMMTGVHPFGWHATAEAGLLYMNDEKTFSISGSIFMDRSSYPVYMPFVPQHSPSISR